MFQHPGKTVLCLVAFCVFPGIQILAQAAPATSDSAGTPAVLLGPSFVPDAKFQGSSLAGWHAMGQAEWSAKMAS